MPALQSDSRVFVAGHRGLVGSAVVRRLAADGVELMTRTRAELDLRDGAAVQAFFEAERPTHVVLAAAKVGGILANRDFPADFVGQNLAIQQAVLMAAHETGVGQRGRVVFLGSTCIYPREAPQPMREVDLLTGPLEPTNRAYAIAKIAGIELAEALHRQHGDDVVSLMPTNLYGPGDNFDLATSHVLPALIRRFHEARRDAGPDAPVTLWGTGSPKREFLHADDLADAVAFVLALDEPTMRAAAPDGLLNVGVGEDLAIRDLAERVRDVVGADSPIRWDTDKPDGTPRKLLDVSRLTALGWRADTSLHDGLASTYDWFREHVATAPAT
ncbi:GDP-L-fucose synthase family protein [Rubrivirga sp. IMCC45206]|uniref:GDP-L-fucose synthase family protein n=1 Tax=Rubrivirga sp. IMCC45206 TaxID=3391614 RepID=UPI00399035DE